MKRMRSTSPGLALFLLTAIGTIGFVDRIVVNALVEPLKAEFDLNDAQIGLLGFAYAALNITLGVVIARLAESRRRLTFTAIGTFLWSLAATASGLVTGWYQLLAMRIAVGVGEAVGLPANQSVVADYYPPQRRASAMSVLLLAPPVGAFIGLAGGGYIAEIWGWRWAFIVTGIPGLLLAALVWVFVAEPGRGTHDVQGDDSVPAIKVVLRRLWNVASARHLVFGSSLAALMGFGLLAFMPALLSRRFGLSTGEAGLTTALMATVPAALAIGLGGFVADRLAPKFPRVYGWLPGISLLLSFPVYGFAVTRDELWQVIALIMFSTLLQFNYLGLTTGTVANLVHHRSRATVNALTNVLGGLAGGIGPLMIGAGSDRLLATGYDTGTALALSMAICSAIYLWAGAHYLFAARTIAGDLADVREGRI
ncbi:D-galactonate transporter [Tsuneonella dongtanensis]|uniref:D-galactonate transporter n=1 Tax=Tsuneonella dongtanensis TaxID=692370 RepID=A0A1B2A982_9SPHN|nr:MFS transporter [Tsuneonella dongtanensis]ANY18733.1 D-galactonate transporter [Tsuneonella dongtanensis]